MLNNFLGADQFIWFKGVVEDREDPLKLGRCKVRIFGWHTQDKIELPTANLPWAYPILPLDNGTNVTGPKLGDWVIGFFRDSVLAQEPIMMGLLPGIPEDPSIPDKGFYDPTPDGELVPELQARPENQVVNKYRIPTPVGIAGDCALAPTPLEEVPPVIDISRYPLEDRLTEPGSSRLARNENIESTYVEFKKNDLALAKLGDHTDSGVGTDTAYPEGTFSEPITPYNAQYPFNHVYQSESGHYIQYDDTPNAERMEWWHKSGTFKEIHPNGSEVNKTRRQRFDFVIHDYYIASYKSINITSNTQMRLKVGAEYNLNTCGDMNNETEKNLNTLVGVDANTRVKNDHNKVVNVDQNYKIKNYKNTIVENHVNNKFLANEHTQILGDQNKQIVGNLNETILQNANIEVLGDGTIVIRGNLKIAVKGNLEVGVDGNIVLDTDKAFTVNSLNADINADLIARMDAGLAAEVSAALNVSNSALLISMNGYTTGDIQAVTSLVAAEIAAGVSPTPLPVPPLPPQSAEHDHQIIVPLITPEDPEG